MENEVKHSNFIHDIIDEDLLANPALKIHTRFPPEPNGYLHIGSVKAICVNTDVANKYSGLFNLRYDDTNPAKESDEFVRSIREDLEWLGATPTGGVFYGSDYFGKCYEFAVQLIKQGDAYVCDLSKDDLADYKGTDRSVRTLIVSKIVLGQIAYICVALFYELYRKLVALSKVV